MRIKVKIFDCLMVCFCLFSIGTIAYSLINPIFPFNRLVGGLILIFLVTICAQNVKRNNFLNYILMIFLVIISFIVCEDYAQNLNDALYWVCCLLSMIIIAEGDLSEKLYQSIKNNKRIIMFTVLINNIILIFGLFKSECYNSAWGGRYFVGYAYSNHVLACGACLTLALTLFIIEDIKNEILKIAVMLPATYAILQTGARTYIISLVIIWILFYFFCLEKTEIKVLLIPIIAVGGFYLFVNSGMLEKILNPSVYSKWSGIDLITNGRTVFWKIDIDAYMNSGLFGILFGNGFDFPYYTNQKLYGLYIWAHNDVIDVLMSVGAIGFCIYFWIGSRVFSILKKNGGIIVTGIVFSYFLLIALVNGFFVYQHYIYSFILIVCFVSNKNRKRVLLPEMQVKA